MRCRVAYTWSAFPTGAAHSFTGIIYSPASHYHCPYRVACSDYRALALQVGLQVSTANPPTRKCV
jgi:hypothetical protein